MPAVSTGDPMNLALRKGLFYARTALLCSFPLLAMGAATNCQTVPQGTSKEWVAVQRLLGGIHGVSTTPPTKVVTPNYTEGALMGNGDIGVVAGDNSTSRQSFHFGKSDFWGARNGLPNNTPECNWTCSVSILSLGQMTISSPTVSASSSDYRVDQDILHARVDSTLRFGDTRVHLRSWTADGENVFVTEVWSDGGRADDLPIQVSLAMPPRDPRSPAIFPSETGAREGMLWAYRENPTTGPKEYKAREAIAVRVLEAKFSHVDTGPGGSAGQFILRGRQHVWVAVIFAGDVRVGMDGPNSRTLVRRAIAHAGQLSLAGIETLEKTHLAWWKRFWLRSFVQVHDPVLEAYYYGALYVLGSTVRENELAPSLFGNFITTDDVAWGGIYFMNYNEEAPYYGVFSSNHPEIAKPYNHMVLAQMPWQKNMTANAGYKGVSYQRVFSPFTLFAKPPAPVHVAEKRDFTKLPADQKSNATFSFIPAIQYYEYTQDEAFLRNELYPAMKELDAFWRDFAVRDPTGKHWVFEHSAAHEGGDDVNPNLDIGFARRIQNELIATSQMLGRDAEMRPVWREFRDELNPYPTGVVNGKTVYLIAASIKNAGQNHDLFEPGDQPINLEGIVFPGEDLSIGGDARQLKIARDSMQEMNSWGVTSGGNSENGFCKLFPIAARVGWPSADLIEKLKAAILHQWRPSNLTVFQDGGGIETSGSIEALDSMLLQHEDGVLRVFPDWPSTDASFTRLRAKGAFLVSSEQRSGTVTSIDIVSERGGPLTIQSPWGIRGIRKNGAPAVLRPNSRGQITFSTTRGGHYHLVCQ
jgi:hypothetical protein